MSAPKSQVVRPGGGGAGTAKPEVTRPGGGGGSPQVVRPGGGGAGERHVWEGPRGGTVIGGGGQKSFTGPGGNTYAGGGANYIYQRPQGGVTVGGGKGGSITTAGGKTIAGGQAGHVTIGPNGNVHAGGSKGLAVKGPDGAAIAGSHGGATVGPGGAIASGSKGIAGVGPGGAFATGSKGVAGGGPGGAFAAGGKGTAIVGPGGGAAVAGHHGAVAAGPYGVAGAGSGIVAGRDVNIGTRYVNNTVLSNQATYVRQNFNNYNAFTPNWYGRYPGAWVAGGLAAGAVWRAASWGGCAGYVGYPADTSPIYYNYGDNVTYQGGDVYYGDQLQATEADYAQQAVQIADTGRQAQPPDDEPWQALGVFAMTKGDEASSNDIFQFAVSKDGVVRGNYYSALSDSTTPIYGSLDKKAQRLAWTIGNKKTPVFETGFYNLTQDQTTLLAHFGPDRTEQYNLFRIEQPKDGGAEQTK